MTTSPLSSDMLRAAIEAELHQIVDANLSAVYPDLKEMITYPMGWTGEGAGAEAQGKRIRSQLVLLCATAAGGDWHSALPAAAAVELLHNFSLVHDDIQDSSPLRRARPTVWKRWSVAQAINTGDVLFTLAFIALGRLSASLPAEQVLQANSLFQNTCLLLTQGQYLDMAYENQPTLPLDAYWPMIRGKTSALLGCCAQLGALVAGADQPRQSSFYEYGVHLGLAFQVLDDWLGIWGDVAVTGKSTDSDLTAGKKSLPVLFGLERNGAFAARWRQGKISAEEAPALADTLHTEGVYDQTLQLAHELTEQALIHLAQAVPDVDAAAELHSLTLKLLERKA